MKTALICGISGQDGAYLCKHLIEKGYKVIGTSRDAQMSSFQSLKTLGIRNQVAVESMSLTDFRSVLQVLDRHKPDEIYNLAGQSSVGLSFQQPVETLDSIVTGTINLLEVLRFIGSDCRLYNACSGECFGDTFHHPADEHSPFRPKSPYAVAKAAAFWAVANYRDAYGLFACSGLLFNHESPLRPARFVTQKIIQYACNLHKNGSTDEKLVLGNIEISRDWGWAPEYIEAMHKILQQDKADDFIIATGESHSLKEFIIETFTQLDLDWQAHIEIHDEFMRPSDIMISDANPAKALMELDWRANYKMKDVIRMMIESKLEN